jgi:hypothetical protein
MSKPVPFGLSADDLISLSEEERLKKLVEAINKASTSLNGILNKGISIADNMQELVASITVQMPQVTGTPFPLYVKAELNNKLFKPVGVSLLQVIDADDPSNALGTIGHPDWEYDPARGVKLKNIPGLAYNHKYNIKLRITAG